MKNEINAAPYWSGDDKDLPPIGCTVEFDIASKPDVPQLGVVTGYEIWRTYDVHKTFLHRIIVNLRTKDGTNGRHLHEVRQCPRDRVVKQLSEALRKDSEPRYLHINDVDYTRLAKIAVDQMKELYE